jgi:hypothetical protein
VARMIVEDAPLLVRRSQRPVLARGRLWQGSACSATRRAPPRRAISCAEAAAP